MIKYKYKYTNTNTNTQVHKYKYAHTNTNTNTGGFPKSNFELWPEKKVFTETAISLEPLDLHRSDTPQNEALCLRDLKNTSGGL